MSGFQRAPGRTWAGTCPPARVQKHVAYFGDTQPDRLERFARAHCDTFAWAMWRQHWKDRPFYSHVLFRRSHAAWAEELISLVSTPATGWQVETERLTGTLPSYSQQEINAWIHWISRRKASRKSSSASCVPPIRKVIHRAVVLNMC